MRANSLTNLGVSIERDIASGFDLIQVVAGIASEIEALAPYADEIATIVANLPDVTTVQQANEVLNSLSVSVTTLSEGSEATATLVGTEVRFGIPRGADGINGIDGVNNYTHVKYASDITGSGISDSSAGKKYIGIATTEDSVASVNPADYEWTKFVGEDGIDGANGADGADGEQGPRGLPGTDGLTPTMTVNYNETTGMLDIDTDYVLTPDTIKEW